MLKGILDKFICIFLIKILTGSLSEKEEDRKTCWSNFSSYHPWHLNTFIDHPKVKHVHFMYYLDVLYSDQTFSINQTTYM